jgi:hypothetical protein
MKMIAAIFLFRMIIMQLEKLTGNKKNKEMSKEE